MPNTVSLEQLDSSGYVARPRLPQRMHELRPIHLWEVLMPMRSSALPLAMKSAMIWLSHALNRPGSFLSASDLSSETQRSAVSPLAFVELIVWLTFWRKLDLSASAQRKSMGGRAARMVLGP